MTPKRWLFTSLLLLTTFRVWFSGTLELTPEESYYYQWSLHPDLCYFSKGPGVAFIIWFGTHVLGPTERGVRLLAPLLSLGTSALIFLLARRLYSEAVAIWALIAITVMPLFQAGSILMTTDPPSIFFWTASLYTFWRALEDANDISTNAPTTNTMWNLWWPATGVVLGVGFLCEWTNFIQFLSIVLLLYSGQNLRRHFRARGFWVMTLVFLAFFLPPFFWNQEHQWVTLTHLINPSGFNDPFHIELTEPLAFLGAQAIGFSPLLFGIMLLTLWRQFPRAPQDFKTNFLILFTIPLLGMHFLLSFKKAGESIWTGPAFISAAILATADWLPSAKENAKIRCFLGFGLVCGLALSIALLNVDSLPAPGFSIPLIRLDPNKRFHGWQTMAEAAEKVRSDTEASLGAPVFLIANRWEVASGIGFYLKDKRLEFPEHPCVYTPESQALEDQYSFWPRYDAIIPLQPDQPLPDSLYTEEGGINPFHGRSALFLTDTEDTALPSAITGGFQKSELIASFDIVRLGRTVSQLRIFACTNYHGRSL